MKQVIKHITEKNLDKARDIIKARIATVVETKLFEKKKEVAAKWSIKMDEAKHGHYPSFGEKGYTGQHGKIEKDPPKEKLIGTHGDITIHSTPYSDGSSEDGGGSKIHVRHKGTNIAIGSYDHEDRGFFFPNPKGKGELGFSSQEKVAAHYSNIPRDKTHYIIKKKK